MDGEWCRLSVDWVTLQTRYAASNRPDQTFYFFFHKIKDKCEDLVMRALARDYSKTLKWEQNVLRLTPGGWVSGESPSAADKHPHNQSAADRNRWCRNDYDMYIFPSCLLNILLWPNRQHFFLLIWTFGFPAWWSFNFQSPRLWQMMSIPDGGIKYPVPMTVGASLIHTKP